MRAFTITASRCINNKLSPRELFNILINSYPNVDAKEDESTRYIQFWRFLQDNFLACLTTSNPYFGSYDTHRIIIKKNEQKEHWAEMCKGIFEEAGFTVKITTRKKEDYISISWRKGQENKKNGKYRLFYSLNRNNPEKQLKPGSKRDMVMKFIDNQKNSLESNVANINSNTDPVTIDPPDEFEGNKYKLMETLFAFLLSEGYKGEIKYLSEEPFATITITGREKVSQKEKEGR